MESKKYHLNNEDLKSIGRGLVIAMFGAGLTYTSALVTQIDFGAWTPLVVTFWSVVVNAIRKLLEGK